MTRDEAIKESREVGLATLYQDAGEGFDAVIDVLFQAFPGKEERDDILRRQAAILAQLMTAVGAEPTHSFEEMLEDMQRAGDKRSAVFEQDVVKIAEMAMEQFK